MATTFQKRQKEMKRLEKSKLKEAKEAGQTGPQIDTTPPEQPPQN